MFRVVQGRKERPSSWTAGVRTAIAVPALTAISLITADVSSLTLSATDVASGGSVTGVVTISPGSRGTTQVTLSSSVPLVAKVPATVLVGRAGRASFTVRAGAGAAGCTYISARTGTTPPKSELLFVQAPAASGMSLDFNPSSAVGGASVSGSVLVINPGSNRTVQLASSNPNVTVPASVQVSPQEGGAHVGTFTVSTQVVGTTTCSVITATHGSSKVRKLLKVFTVGG